MEGKRVLKKARIEIGKETDEKLQKGEEMGRDRYVLLLGKENNKTKEQPNLKETVAGN